MANVENLKPWPKGVSGNPGGRPKRKPLQEAIDKLLTSEKAEEIILAHIAAAASKNPNTLAAQFLRDTYEGRPTQAHEITGDLNITSDRDLIAKRRAQRLDGDRDGG